MNDQELADRVKRHGGLVSVSVDREELTWLRQAAASKPGPNLADFAAVPAEDRANHFVNEALAEADLKRRLLMLLAFAQARFE